MKNKPVYGISSVDHALRLVGVLMQEGPLRVTDAAERLGVSRSTAHRLLTMLVYRDFAEQDERRHYVAGPILRRPTEAEPVADLRRIALPHLRELAAGIGETTNLVVVIGDQARFVATVECEHILRVGDREGRMLPAHLASGGRAVLASRTESEVRELYSGAESTVADVDRLLRDLGRVRRQGFAVNDQKTETGVVAIGVAVPGPVDRVPAGVSVAMPTVRYRREHLAAWARSVTAAAERIALELDWALPAPALAARLP